MVHAIIKYTLFCPYIRLRTSRSDPNARSITLPSSSLHRYHTVPMYVRRGYKGVVFGYHNCLKCSDNRISLSENTLFQLNPNILILKHFTDFVPPTLGFRERAITLASMDPPAYNRSELKRDILRGGLVVWRSRGKEEGLPWDRRSWEVTPQFWSKWGWLIEEQGRVEQQSKWWQSMRGK
jgi:hypothetical protein